MAKRTVEDLLAALETVDMLERAVARQDQTIALILDRLDALEAALRGPRE